MDVEADAWILPAGDRSSPRTRGQLVREKIRLRRPAEGEVLAAPLYGCWEANMSHALDRNPIDVCHARDEPSVVLGNAAVMEIIEVGSGVHDVKPGQKAMLYATERADRFGFPITVIGYDGQGTMGCLSSLVIVRAEQVIPLPEHTRHSMAQWAAFAVRYVTAWSNWQTAFRCFRTYADADTVPALWVWGWGGGTTFAELTLAKHFGCRCAMISGRTERLQQIAAAGLEAVDRRMFDGLSYDPDAYSSDPAYRERFRAAEERFVREVESLTNGAMVDIFVDYIGLPVARSTVKALARGGIITTAGWKRGMHLSYVRAQACIDRHQYIHTHYASRRQALEALAFAEENDWMPQLDDPIRTFDEIPALAEDFGAGKTGYFPVFSVCGSSTNEPSLS